MGRPLRKVIRPPTVNPRLVRRTKTLSLPRYGMAPLTRRGLASDTWTPHPRSRNNSCFRSFSVCSVICFYILLQATNMHCATRRSPPDLAPNLTQRAKKRLARISSLNVTLHAPAQRTATYALFPPKSELFGQSVLNPAISPESVITHHVTS